MIFFIGLHRGHTQINLHIFTQVSLEIVVLSRIYGFVSQNNFDGQVMRAELDLTPNCLIPAANINTRQTLRLRRNSLKEIL